MTTPFLVMTQSAVCLNTFEHKAQAIEWAKSFAVYLSPGLQIHIMRAGCLIESIKTGLEGTLITT